MMMPAKFNNVTKMKNFRYVLNQRQKRIHLCLVGGTTGTGAWMVWFSAGSGSDRTGTLEDGVMPSAMGEMGDKNVLGGFFVLVSALSRTGRL